MEDSAALAGRKWGIEPGYHDVFGRWHETPQRTLEKLTGALAAGGVVPRAPDAQGGDHSRAYQGDGKRHWGLAVQLYSVRSADNSGIGDFADLRTIVRLAAEAGASAVGLNPLHALFAGSASPYAPNSRLFLNPIYIALDAVEDFESSSFDDLVARVAALRDRPLVDYAGVAVLKDEALRAAFARFRERASPERRKDFEKFKVECGESLSRFAVFESLRARYKTPWQEWPEPWRSPDGDMIARYRSENDAECAYHEYLQWLADRQLTACQQAAREAGMAIGLYLDIAVGVDPCGADAWSQQAVVLRGVSVGAPPDAFNPAGQDWGLAPFNPHAIGSDDFAVFRAVLSAAMRHAGAIRIDHVLGLMRLFLIPRGEAGAYVRFPFEALLRVVAEESNRHRCVVIGEDLGTVPEGFRETMAAWGLWSYRVMLFEREHGGGFKAPDAYPPNAVATFNTHDLPTFRGWATGGDLAAKRAIGVDPGESDDDRRHSQHMLRDALARLSPDGDVFPAIAAYLAQTPSHLVMVAIEDLLDVPDQVNVPGTVDQHPNWRRKLPAPLEEWLRHPTFGRTIDVLRASGRTR